MVESVIVRRVSIRMSPARPSARSPSARTHISLARSVSCCSADQVADVLGVAADGRARARAALAPDEIRDFVDGGAVCDGRVHGLAKLRRQPRDRGTPERRGCRCLWGFVLHEPMLARAAPALHRTMVRGFTRPATDEASAISGAGLRSRPDGATAPRAEWRVAKRAERAPGA